MKHYALFIINFFFFTFLFSQNVIDTKDDLNIKSIIGFNPSKVDVVNGITFKYWYEQDTPIKTNGLEVDINPLNVFFPFLSAVYSYEILQYGPPANDLKDLNTTQFDRINGIRLGLASLESAIVNGLEVNLSGSFETLLTGISISPLINKHYKVNGIGLGLLGNMDTQVNGIQIGLFNNCNDLKGLQIGLWNKNSKRSLPFINWQF